MAKMAENKGVAVSDGFLPLRPKPSSISGIRFAF